MILNLVTACRAVQTTTANERILEAHGWGGHVVAVGDLGGQFHARRRLARKKPSTLTQAVERLHASVNLLPDLTERGEALRVRALSRSRVLEAPMHALCNSRKYGAGIARVIANSHDNVELLAGEFVHRLRALL